MDQNEHLFPGVVSCAGELHLTIFNRSTGELVLFPRDMAASPAMFIMRFLLRPTPRVIPNTGGILVAVHDVGTQRRRIELSRKELLLVGELDWSRTPSPSDLPREVKKPWLVIDMQPAIRNESENIHHLLARMIAVAAWAAIDAAIQQN